ncbi:MAG: protein translocase subunit SecD [Gammaproteobacteria bacterium]
MRPYPRWKYILLVVTVALGALYALPNVFGEEPAVQVAARSGDPLPEALAEQVGKALAGANIASTGTSTVEGRFMARFADEAAQLRAADVLKRELGNQYVVALNLAPRTPEWLRAIGGKPMALGLDLRGGVHFLIEVDIDDVRKKAVESYLNELPAALRKQGIRYSGRRLAGDAVVLEFQDTATVEAARKLIAGDHAELELAVPPNQPLVLQARISQREAERIQTFAVQQNLTTLRNRVNELGVAEPVVQRQGANRIVVQLPGVQDPTRAKELLKATATLEYRAVVESGGEVFYQREGGNAVMLSREIIAAGSQLVDAAPTVDQDGSPAVSVTLDGAGAKRMLDFTQKSVGKPMAVLFRETRYDTSYDDAGNAVRKKVEVEDVISVATIRGVFGKRFQTTGLSSKEAQELAVLLRAGALAAPVDIVEERTVGPSLGADNIRQGFAAAALGLGLVAVFMAFYYRVFGLFAIAALLMNIGIVVAVLSLFGATLTMPGIAGIVLHMGIAVDANVLIYERIREELRNGNSPHTAIQAGYDRAFLTIADANITVLIGTVVLFALGAGPVKGFAITLAIGIISSQFTAIVGSRALAQLAFARRKMTDVPVW